jgi:hypothetical protein
VQKECNTQIKEKKERMVCSAVAGRNNIFKEFFIGLPLEIRRLFQLD